MFDEAAERAGVALCNYGASRKDDQEAVHRRNAASPEYLPSD
jgi:hypothetical protein